MDESTANIIARRMCYSMQNAADHHPNLRYEKTPLWLIPIALIVDVGRAIKNAWQDIRHG